MKHDLMTTDDCGCDDSHCHVCVGGLAFCKVCKGAEGSLPTDCPGVPLTEDQEDGIYHRGDLDFRNGKWVDPRRLHDEICSVCGCSFANPPVPMEYNRCFVWVTIDGESFLLPACAPCAHGAYDVVFRAFFGFLYGTDRTSCAVNDLPGTVR